MSIESSSLSDAFARASISPALTDVFTMSLGGWVKFTAAPTFKTIAAAGYSAAHLHKIQRRSTNLLRYGFRSTAPDSSAEVNQAVPTLDTWYYVLATRTDGLSGTIKISDAGGAFVTDTDVTDVSAGTWFGDLDAVSFFSEQLNLSAPTEHYQGCKLADWGFWNRELTTEEADSLRGGASPKSIPTNLISNWMVDAGSLSGSLLDGTSSNHLTEYEVSDPGVGSPLNPLTYSADHPAVSSGPVLSNLSVTEGDTTADISVTSNSATGTLYAGVYAQGSTPTHAEIAAGTGAVGTPIVVSESPPVAGVNAMTQVTGLAASTTYTAAASQVDGDTSESSPIYVDFTANASPELVIDIPVDNVGTPIADGVSINYRLSTGTSSDAETEGLTGTVVTSGGQVTVPATGSTVGDTLIFTGDAPNETLDGAGADIASPNTRHLRGVGVVT